ncbi:uncharacterized protein LOC123318517 isoform X2 [Coccinella septempunctata]|uniref:uncharacterized protein LOC123318517 isoform X2 n=1 Tax=Coccinella septempunctata TaxID=41139 RepID=UPI001D0650F0|nr:uncharacterized protein LOC123318517 isoform X2 [Coccinella septempunctata]
MKKTCVIFLLIILILAASFTPEKNFFQQNSKRESPGVLRKPEVKSNTFLQKMKVVGENLKKIVRNLPVLELR